jgi:uncharacterized protein YdcH (DUF465 family)
MGENHPSIYADEITHRAYFPNRSTRRGNLNWEELPMERNAQEELKAHLMSNSEEYRQLAAQHLDFARQLDELESHPHLTDAEQMEETRLKKLKLRLKDQMEAILSHYRAQQVA